MLNVKCSVINYGKFYCAKNQDELIKKDISMFECTEDEFNDDNFFKEQIKMFTSEDYLTFTVDRQENNFVYLDVCDRKTLLYVFIFQAVDTDE